MDWRQWRGDSAHKKRDGGSRSAGTAVLRAVVILMFGILVIQLVNLQVIKGEEYSDQAEINALREVPIPAARGLIYDRNGVPLVENSALFTVTITPGDLPDRGEAAVYRSISEVIGMPVAEIDSKVQDGIEQGGEFSPAVIKTGVDRDTALILIELAPQTPGLHVEVEPSRRYLTGDLMSHILGYVGPISAEEYAELESQGYLYQDQVGKTGVEATYESALRGRPGNKFVEVDAMGRELRTLAERPSIDGSNVVLSIDSELQKYTADVLKEFAGSSDNAAAAVMDIRTGEMLAMVSLPTFDNNLFASGLSQEELTALVDAPGKPLVNHVMAERYPPGSTFKAIVGSAALQESVATPYTTITSRGYITVENEFDENVVYVYPDWAPLGTLDFYSGLAMSSNVYFYYLAGGKADEGFRGLGEERVAKYARSFGLGTPTGIDLPGESEGLVPDAKWKDETIGEPWTVGDTYNFGIGQGYVAATPLQMLTAASAIANGGSLVTPHVVKEYRDSRGNVIEPVTREPRGNVGVEDGYLDIVRAGMRQSVTNGVARNAATAGVAVAGKTGTAEFGAQLANGKYETHGWFIGFAPYDDPQIAVVVFVQRGSGGNDASPAASRIFDYYFNGRRQSGRDEEPSSTEAPTPEPEPGATEAATPEAEPQQTEPPAGDPAPVTPAPEPTAPPVEVTPPPEPPPETPVPEETPVETPVPEAPTTAHMPVRLQERRL